MAEGIVYNKECLEGMHNIADKSIDMILCDLPYGTTKNSWDVVIPFEPLWLHYDRIIKDNGAIVLTAMQPFTSMLITSKISLFKYCWSWNKSQSTGFLNAKKQPLRAIEDICVFYKRQCIYNPQIEYKNNKQNIRSSYGKVKEIGGNYNKSVKDIKNRVIPIDKTYPTNILFFNNVTPAKSIHPTQKPVPLFEYLIKTYTNEGETVLDNCAGSGTTAIACINTNRNYILMEKEQKYFDIINERIKRHTPQLKLAL